MRPPLDWGDGGTFPEEWTDMHKRFRRGLQHLVDWYASAKHPTQMVTKIASRGPREPWARPGTAAAPIEDDIETEAIVILVSHGAGCNALIGAITHQPVLTDVAMASLTMAVRKPQKSALEEEDDMPVFRPPGQTSIPVHEQYELKIFASSEHLRSPPATPAQSRHASIADVVNGSHRGVSNNISSALSSFSFHETSPRRNSAVTPMSSSLRSDFASANTTARPGYGFAGNGRAGGITVGSGMTSFGTKNFSLARAPSLGLWSPATSRFEDDDVDDDDDGMLLNFSHEKPLPPSSSKNQTTNPGLGLGMNITTPPPDVDPPTSASAPSEDDVNTPRAVPSVNPMESTRTESKSTVISEESESWIGAPFDEPGIVHELSSSKRRWTVTERG